MRELLSLSAAATCAALAFGSPAFAYEPLVQTFAAAATAILSSVGPPDSVGTVLGATQTGAFSTSAELGSFNRTWYLPTPGAPGIALSVTGATTGTAGAPFVDGSPPDYTHAMASFSVAAETMSLIPPKAQGGPPLFSISLTNAYGNASIGSGPYGFNSGGGYSSVGTVKLTGTLLGSNTIEAPPNAPPNTVIFDQGGVKVTVNAVTPWTLETYPAGGVAAAVYIELENVSFGGRHVTGRLSMGGAEIIGNPE